MSKLVTLQYHIVSRRFFPSGGFVPYRLFRHHLSKLRSLNLSSPSLREIFALNSADGRKVLITFDDCPKDLLNYAVPELLKYGFGAIFFVVASFIGKKNEWDPFFLGRYEHLSASDLRELRRLGFYVGSHSLTHSDLTRIGDEELKREVFDSKKLIEDLVGEEVYFFSYPYGRFNKKAKKAVNESGYKLAFASSSAPQGDPLAVRRRGVYLIDFSITLKLHDEFPYAFERKKEVLIQQFSSLSGFVKHRLPIFSKLLKMSPL